MKSMFYKMPLVILSLIVTFGVTAPAYASILGVSDSFIKAKIDASKGNALQNRDNRNELLEKITTDGQPRPTAPEERQSLLLQQLSVTVANLQNIQTRIQARVTAEATSGNDVSNIEALLSTASNTLVIASSSIEDITASIFSTTTPSYDARTDIMNVILEVTFIKNTLQQALTALEQII